jgi:biopolymer transport protein TolR
MAVQLNAGSVRNHSKRRGGYRPMADINVTPMVDVMLVLLIVFMVTAPLLSVGVPVDLPKTQAGALTQNVEPVTITVNSGGIYIQEEEVPLDQLVAKLQAIAGTKTDTTVFVRGDKGIAYGRIMEVMGMVSQAGITKVSLISQAPDGGKGAPQPGKNR